MSTVYDYRMLWFTPDKYRDHPDFVKFKLYVPEFDIEHYLDPKVRAKNVEILKKKSSMYKEIIGNKGGWLFPQKIYLNDINFIEKAEDQIKVLDSFLMNQKMARSIYTRFRYVSDDLVPNMVKQFLEKQDSVKIASFGSGTGVDVLEALKYFDDNVTADFIETDPKAIEVGRAIAKKMGLSSRVRFFQESLTALKLHEKYDIGLMVGIICPLPDYIASKVMAKVKKNLVKDGLLMVSSSSKMMGQEDPLNRFLAEYTTAWFLNFRTDKRMRLVGKDAGYKVLDVIHEPMDYNKFVICQNV